MEIYQDYGNDLIITIGGDLETADSTLLSNQRIIRRLLTTPISVNNPPDYLDHPNYGAGLPQFVGQNETPEIINKITGLILSNMFLEETVSQDPPPTIVITGLPEQINCSITYTNILTNSQAVLTFVVPPPLPNTLYATLTTSNAS